MAITKINPPKTINNQILMLSSLKLVTCTPLEKQELTRVKTIWKSIYDNNQSVEFRKPVEWKSMGLMDYPNYVKNPMDLSCIRTKLKHEKYQTVQQVLDEIQLIWDNCKCYNQKNAWIYNVAEKLQKSFKKMVHAYLPKIKFQSAIGVEGIKKMMNSDEGKKQNYQFNQNADQMVNEDSLNSDEISYQEKLNLIERLKVLTPEKLALAVEKITSIAPNSYKQEEVDDKKSAILIDMLDRKSFKILFETVDELCIEGEKPTKKIKI